MLGLDEKPRVLLVSSREVREELEGAFEHHALAAWDLAGADTFTQARFQLQFEHCQLLLVHQDVLEREGGQGLTWLVWNRHLPVVFLAAGAPALAARAYECGACQSVACAEAVAHPMFLARVLERALHCHDMEVRLNYTRDRLNTSRRHVDRLMNVLWRVTPGNAETPWFSQRHMMDRLQEELARGTRHQLALSVLIGELDDAPGSTLPPWAVDVLSRSKRRCDALGQYGGGFLMLLVHTAAEGALACARRLRQVIEHAREGQPGPHAPHAYFGVATMTEEKNTAITLLRAAEEGVETARRDSCERIAVG